MSRQVRWMPAEGKKKHPELDHTSDFECAIQPVTPQFRAGGYKRVRGEDSPLREGEVKMHKAGWSAIGLDE